MMMKIWIVALLLLIFCSGLSWAVDAELKADLIKRRSALASKIGDKSMLIVFSAPERSKTGDVIYEYRQSNNLYYLTGISQSDTTLVLMPGNETRKEMIFVQERDPRRETWTGKILSKEEVTEISGIQTVYSSSEFENFVGTIMNLFPYKAPRYGLSTEYDVYFEALKNSQANIYLVFEEPQSFTGELTRETQFGNRLKERFRGFTIRDAWPELTYMRQVKSPYEIKMLKMAIDITADAHLRAFKTAKPDAWEYEIEAVIEETYKRRNAFDWGFPSIIASGPNATTLHYEASQRQMKAGELLLMDIGAEYAFYTADITRTIPVNGKFSREQAEIYNIVFEAQEASMKTIKPGVKLPDVHNAGKEVVVQGLKRLGLITDTTGDQSGMWFMHGVSHWLGMDVHDTGESGRALEPGMAFTVEPGIYIREDALDNLPPTPENEKLKAAIKPAFEKYKNIGVRIEDDVLVTSTGYELLSKKLPRAIADVEKAMKQ
jgi:Xaa-Pro aminopeptidase